ncbi:MAG: transposase [Parcubacteria group bacterium]|jgi:REP element-mobilizing transposase RayT
MRKTQFANGEYYHIYNRGVDKRDVFLGEEYFERFLLSIQEFNRQDAIGSIYQNSFKQSEVVLGTKSPIGDLVPATSPIVEIIAYCLNPNHFHFILKQLGDGGISKFMLKLSSGYTTYFNKKQKRSGSLFQGPFKSIHINSNEYLLYLSAYVNCNSEVHGIEEAEDYKWCSFLDYMGKRKGILCNKEMVLGQFKNNEEYREYAKTNALAMKDKKDMEKLVLE